jgi:hypothetical protein
VHDREPEDARTIVILLGLPGERDIAPLAPIYLPEINEAWPFSDVDGLRACENSFKGLNLGLNTSVGSRSPRSEGYRQALACSTDTENARGIQIPS